MTTLGTSMNFLRISQTQVIYELTLQSVSNKCLQGCNSFRTYVNPAN